MCVEEEKGGERERGVCGLGKHSSASFWLQGYCCPPSSVWDSVVKFTGGVILERWIFLMGTLKARDKCQPRAGEVFSISQIVQKRHSSCLTLL